MTPRLPRRDFLHWTAAAAGVAVAPAFRFVPSVPHSGNPVPITVAERRARVARAQALLKENSFGALVMESGSALNYFTGLHWWPSERTMVAILFASGDPVYIGPAFEEGRLREQITLGERVYVWQEDESPYAQIARAFGDAGLGAGKIGIEEQTRFFIADGIRQAAPAFQYASGDPVTIPCRLIKSPPEIALMQAATDITVEGIKAGIAALKAGVSRNAIADIIAGTQTKLGGSDPDVLVLFGEGTASPHGGERNATLKSGDTVVMDCGCKVQGYTSDITRTVVFGKPTDRQRSVWDLEKKAQLAGFAAAQIGQPCENVDRAARGVIVAAGFGPGYKLPGLPHRTGHGIGLDVHEWGNMVEGNTLKMQAGMCFSIEPMIVIPGEFGIRHEDCVHMTPEGPRWFSQPAISLEKPF